MGKKSDNKPGNEETRALIKKALMSVEDVEGLMDEVQRNMDKAEAMRVHIFKSKKPKQGSK